MASAMSCDAVMLVVLAASVCDSGSGSVIVSGVGGGGVGFEMCCIFVAGQLWQANNVCKLPNVGICVDEWLQQCSGSISDSPRQW